MFMMKTELPLQMYKSEDGQQYGFDIRIKTSLILTHLVSFNVVLDDIMT